jgi:thiamine biosynthesis lipoprotein
MAAFSRRPSTGKSNRRQFLLGQAALDAMEQLVDEIDPDQPSASSQRYLGSRPATNFLLQFSRHAMACEFTIYLNITAAPGHVEAAIAALDRVAELENQLSVYRPESEVSRLNHAAAHDAVEVEEGLFELLLRSQQLHAETNGAFDITSGPLSKAWGFFERRGRVPAPAELQAARALVGTEFLELHAATKSVRYWKPGVEINLGAIGKGYALDQARDLLVLSGVDDFIIHGGQSSVMARGDRQGVSGGGWQIDIRHPLRPALKLAKLTLRDRAVGTSGSAVQQFRVGQNRYSHIIDPRDGQPADKILSSTVLAPDAATADALGTAFFIMGADRAQEYCDSHPDIGALLIRDGEKIGDIVVDLVNLDADTLELIPDTNSRDYGDLR